MKQLFATIMFLVFGFNAASSSDFGNTRVSLKGQTGSGDVRLNGTDYSVDTDGSSITTITYTDSLYFEGGIGSSDLTLAGVTISSDLSMVGLGYVDGRTDFILGSGEEFRFGIQIIDLEVTLGSYTSSETVKEIGFGNVYGMGDGMTLGYGISTDLDDIFSDNTYTGSFSKSFGSAIFMLEIGYNSYVTDARNSGNATTVSFGIGTQF